MNVLNSLLEINTIKVEILLCDVISCNQSRPIESVGDLVNSLLYKFHGFPGIILVAFYCVSNRISANVHAR